MIQSEVNDVGYKELFHKAMSDNKAIDTALEEAKKQDLIIMDPRMDRYNDETEFDKRWDAYSGMTKPFRRKADWITIEYIGMSNQEIYDAVKSQSISNEVTPTKVRDTSVRLDIEGFVVKEDSTTDLSYTSAADNVDVESILANMDNADIEINNASAINWMNNTGKIMICPALRILNVDELDRAWEAYNIMTHKHRREADFMCIELYGFTSMQYYIYLKKLLLSEDSYSGYDVDNVNTVYEYSLIRRYFDRLLENDATASELAEGLTNILTSQDNFDSSVSANIVSDVLDKYDGLTGNIVSMDTDVSNMPMYTPDELIDIGVYSNIDMDINLTEENEWFEEYCNYYYSGIVSDKYKELNLDRVHKLEEHYKLNTLTNKEIWEMGWNPHIPFSESNRAIANKKISTILKESANTSSFIDMRDIVESQSDNDKLPLREDMDNDKDLKPIYIVLEEGKRPIFSDAIMALTKGVFSHAMLAFDATLERLYSFGVDTKAKILGSFIVENIKNKPKEALLKVYTVFVSSEVYNRIKTNVEWFIEHQKETWYNWKNLIAYIFRIPSDSDTSMICPQFVDKMLKLGGIDLTKRNSALVAPNDIDRAAKKNRKIYTVFSDLLAKYNPVKIINTVKKLMTKAKPIAEMSSLLQTESAALSYTRSYITDIDVLREVSASLPSVSNPSMHSIYNRLIRPCLEAREIPIKISGNGDITIRNLAPIDFEAAYAKSHKLLVEYSKAGNYDGMKKELCFLWYLNIIIEKKLHSMMISPDKKKKLTDARAKILNDFKKYMQELLDYDSDFDFREYFESSEYSDAAYKISSGTIKGTIALIKKLI